MFEGWSSAKIVHQFPAGGMKFIRDSRADVSSPSFPAWLACIPSSRYEGTRFAFARLGNQRTSTRFRCCLPRGRVQTTCDFHKKSNTTTNHQALGFFLAAPLVVLPLVFPFLAAGLVANGASSSSLSITTTSGCSLRFTPPLVATVAGSSSIMSSLVELGAVAGAAAFLVLA